MEVASGKTEICMEAAAVVHIGRLFSLPPLQLKFLLTTETAQGHYFRCWGTRTQKTTGFSRWVLHVGCFVLGSSWVPLGGRCSVVDGWECIRITGQHPARLRSLISSQGRAEGWQ